MRKFLCTMSLLVIATSLAVASTQVQFFDTSGNLITNASVVVTVSEMDGTPVVKTVLPPDSDGTYDVPVQVGQKARFSVVSGVNNLSTSRDLQVKIATNPGVPIPIVVAPQGTANDTCAGAQPIAIGTVTNDTTVGATADGAPVCGTSNTAPGVWFTVVGDGTTLTASTCPTVGNPAGSAGYDTKITVYCQECAALTCVGGNDDVTGCNFRSAVTFCSQPAALYRILVHGFSSGTGPFGLGLSSNGTACTATINCLPPEPMGACCFTSECPYSQGEVPVSCEDDVEEPDCTAAGGVWQGEDTTCVVPVNQIDVVVNPALPIPDNTPAGITSTLSVPTSAIISDLNVDIGISHTWVSDLIVTVTGPTGTSQILWNQVCGSSDNINATADDSGTETFCAPIGAGPIDSVFYPPALAGDGPLSVFNGTNALGTWTLNVSDNWSADTGTINQWSVHIIEGAGICAEIPCPTGGGGGGGGCDEDEDEDGDGGQGFIDAVGVETGTAPSEFGLRNQNTGNGTPVAPDHGRGRMDSRRR